MYIVSLRGEFGLRLMAQFHLLILMSGISLSLIQYAPLEILIVTAVFISYVFLNRHMLKHKELLQFNSAGNSNRAFPRSQIAKRTIFYAHLVLALTGLLTTILILVSNLPFPVNGHPEVRITLGFWVFYYFGNLGLIGLINHAQQKGELHNDE